jgi:hypothetical protein
MNDSMERGDTQSRNSLSKTGVSAVFQLAGGVLLAVLGALPVLLSTIAGGALTLVGLAGVSSRDNEDKKIGTVLTLAGAATVLSRHGVLPILKAAGGLVLNAGAFALVGLGLFNIIRFIVGVRKRS